MTMGPGKGIHQIGRTSTRTQDTILTLVITLVVWGLAALAVYFIFFKPPIYSVKDRPFVDIVLMGNYKVETVGSVGIEATSDFQDLLFPLDGRPKLSGKVEEKQIGVESSTSSIQYRLSRTEIQGEYLTEHLVTIRLRSGVVKIHSPVAVKVILLVITIVAATLIWGGLLITQANS